MQNTKQPAEAVRTVCWWSRSHRCKGRIDNSDLNEGARRPVSLPNSEHFTHLMIARTHKQNYHSGMSRTLSQIMPNVALFDIFIFSFDLLNFYCISLYLYSISIHCYCIFLYLNSVSIHCYCIFLYLNSISIHCYCISLYLYSISIHCYCIFLYLNSISVHF